MLCMRCTGNNSRLFPEVPDSAVIWSFIQLQIAKVPEKYTQEY